MNRCTALSRLAGLLSALGMVLVAASCHSSKRDQPGKPLHPVRGLVFVQGKPAVGAEVLFIPENEPADPKDPRPRATVESDGSFKLSTYGAHDGAPAGNYRVIITWPGGVLPSGQEEPEDKLLGRYDAANSRLKATVKEGPNDLPPYKLN